MSDEHRTNKENAHSNLVRFQADLGEHALAFGQRTLEAMFLVLSFRR